MFDTVAGQCVEALNVDEGHQVFFNAFTVREVSIRGLLATGRTGQAVDLAERFAAGESPPTPQWRVIEQVTIADLLARAGDDRASVGMLSAALSDAETLHLSHQVQRIIRLTDVAGRLKHPTVRMQAHSAWRG